MQVWSGSLDWQAVVGQEGRGGESGVYISDEVSAHVNLLYYVSTAIYIYLSHILYERLFQYGEIFILRSSKSFSSSD